MEFPSALEFLEMFGIAPTEEGSECCRYVKQSSDGQVELDISFSTVADSFEVTLRCAGRSVMTITSEKVRLVELRRDSLGSGIHVLFDICGVMSEATVMLEPDVYCNWWTLQN
jgi:hypothetical protein